MVRVLCAAVILITAACASGADVDTVASAAVEPSVAATALPTTQAVPAAPTVAPTSIEIPEQTTPVATPTPAPIETPTTPPPISEATGEPESPPATAVAVQPTVGAPPPPTAQPAAPPSTDSQAVQVANGAEVYLLSCARCHGANGGGEIYGGLISVGGKYTTTGMIEELTNGHPVTFGFANELSADEIASVVAYVKATFP